MGTTTVILIAVGSVPALVLVFKSIGLEIQIQQAPIVQQIAAVTNMQEYDRLTCVLMICIPLLGAVFTVIIILAVHARKQQEAKNDAAPAVTFSATGIKKQRYSTRHSVSAPVHYELTLQTADGEVMTPAVPAEVYHACNEGDLGDLTVQGTRFIGFKPQTGAQL